jgi:SAM-dependent methyltransferase/thioredoxin-like negative regulator of GroEL
MTENHRLAVESYRSGKLSEADKLMGAVLTQEQTSETWNDWAMVQLALGRSQDAEHGFRKALQLDQSYNKAAANLGILLFTSTRFNESAPFLQKALPEANNQEREMLTRMIAKCEAKKAPSQTAPNQFAMVTNSNSSAAAVKPVVDIALEAAPKVSAAEKDLLKIYQKFDTELMNLRAEAQNFVARNPENVEAHFFLADVLLAGGRGDEAIVEYEKLKAISNANQVGRAEQGIQQCNSDRGYFPPEYGKRLTSGEYMNGINSKAWRSYANREIQRGRAIARQVRKHIPLHGRRMLDVGCGYGGTLVCFAEQGCNVVGIEIDTERARVGRKRLADLGIQADYRVDDICSAGIKDRVGTFDIIVVQDVLEHVMEPTKTISALSSLLRKGGVIYVVVGNKYSPDQLLADHHYAQAGMTILSRPQAIEYFKIATGSPADHYGVGYWRTEGYYRRMFSRSGVQLDHIGSYATIHHVLWYAKCIVDVCKRAEKDIHPKLPQVLQDRIRRRMMVVARYFSHISDIINKSAQDPKLQAVLCDRLVKKICLPTWVFVGVKK